MIPDELAPVLLRHLVNVSDDTEVEIAFGDQILAVRDGFDEDDPDAWGTGPLPTPPPGITVAVDPPEDPQVGAGYADFLGIGFINPDGTRSL